MLTGVVLFLAPESLAQLAMALLIAAYFMTLHVKFSPFVDQKDALLQTVSVVSSVLTLTLAILLKASSVARRATHLSNAE